MHERGHCRSSPRVEPELGVGGPATRVILDTPEYVTPGGAVAVLVNLVNTGDEPWNDYVQIDVTYPPGVIPAESMEGVPSPCQVVGQKAECSAETAGIEPGAKRTFAFYTTVEPQISGPVTGMIEVSGGGAAETYVEPFTITVGPAGPFAIRSFDISMDPLPDSPPNQAGGRPAELSSTFTLRSETKTLLGLPPGAGADRTAPTEQIRDVVAHVPPGFIGDPSATPEHCTASELVSLSSDPASVQRIQPGIPLPVQWRPGPIPAQPHLLPGHAAAVGHRDGHLPEPGQVRQRQYDHRPDRGMRQGALRSRPLSVSLGACGRFPKRLDLGLTIPQDTSPNGLARADLRSATLALPEGVTINPASADGLAASSPPSTARSTSTWWDGSIPTRRPGACGRPSTASPTPRSPSSS